MTARYRVIADELRRRITDGDYPTGTSLPPQKVLAASYHTTRAVISEAVRVLEGEGLVRPVRRRGTSSSGRPHAAGSTAAPGSPATPSTPRRASPRPRQPDTTSPPPRPSSGRSTAGKCFRGAMPGPGSRVARRHRGNPVIRRRRVTSPAGEAPFQLVDSWIHPGGVADAPRAAHPTGPGGYLDRLEEAGHGPISWTEHIRARMPAAEEADLLQIAIRAVVFELARVGTSAKTRAPVEVTMCVLPADRAEIIIPLIRASSARLPLASS